MNERFEDSDCRGFVGKRPAAEDEGEGVGLTLYEFWQEILLKEFDTLVASKGYDTSVKVGILLYHPPQELLTVNLLLPRMEPLRLCKMQKVPNEKCRCTSGVLQPALDPKLLVL